MAWRRPGDKPLSEPMMVSLMTHICVTRPQWVNNYMSKISFKFPKGQRVKMVGCQKRVPNMATRLTYSTAVALLLFPCELCVYCVCEAWYCMCMHLDVWVCINNTTYSEYLVVLPLKLTKDTTNKNTDELWVSYVSSSSQQLCHYLNVIFC